MQIIVFYLQIITQSYVQTFVSKWAAKEDIFSSEYVPRLYMELDIASGRHEAEHGTDQNIFQAPVK